MIATLIDIFIAYQTAANVKGRNPGGGSSVFIGEEVGTFSRKTYTL